MRRWFLIGVLLVGCGDGPTSPTPPASFSGTVTDTVTGATIPSFTATLLGSNRVRLEAAGYVTRETTIRSTVDLIPEAGFDVAFYRQFARGELDGGGLQPLRILTAAPSIYLQSGPTDSAALESAARATIPALTGGRFTVSRFETGADTRPEQLGWIVIEWVTEPTNAQCGRAAIGAGAGHVWLNAGRTCTWPAVLAHELGHALGFYHVTAAGSLMNASRPHGEFRAATAIERHHAAIAYARQTGNRDLDIDP